MRQLYFPLTANYPRLKTDVFFADYCNKYKYDGFVNDDGYVDVVLPEIDKAPYVHILEAEIPLKSGKYITVTDYSSAGKLWTEESKMAVWMLTK